MGSNCTKKRFEEKDLETAQQYLKTGDECYKRKSFVNAINYYQKALEIESVLKRKDRALLIKHYRSLSASFQGLQDYEQALIYENKARRLALKNKRKHIISLLNIYKTLGLIYEELDQLKETYKYCRIRIKEAKSYLGKRNIEYEKAIFDFAVISLKYKGEKDALKQFNLFCKNIKNTQGDNHPLAADCYNHLGKIMKDQGKLLLALKYYCKSVCLYEEVLQKRDLDVAGVYYKIAIIQKDVMDFQGSWSSLKRCIEIQVEFLTNDLSSLEETVKMMIYVAKILPEAKKELVQRIDWLERKLTIKGDSQIIMSKSLRKNPLFSLDLERLKTSLSFNPRHVRYSLDSDSEEEEVDFPLTEGRPSHTVKKRFFPNAASVETEASFLAAGDVRISLINNPH